MNTKLKMVGIRHLLGERLVRTLEVPEEIKNTAALLFKSQKASLSHYGGSKCMGAYASVVDYRLQNDGTTSAIIWIINYANADKPSAEAIEYAALNGISVDYNIGGPCSFPSLTATKKFSLSKEEWDLATTIAKNGYIEQIPEGKITVEAASGFDDDNYRLTNDARDSLCQDPASLIEVTQPKKVELGYGDEYLARSIQDGELHFQLNVVTSILNDVKEVILVSQPVDNWLPIDLERMTLDY